MATEFRERMVEAAGCSLHVVEAGATNGPAVLLLHGWPQSGAAWRPMMQVASDRIRTIAIDLPGVGRSSADPTDGSKAQLAEVVHALIVAMRLREVTLVGHDVGGMIVFTYLREYDDLARAVIMDVVIPGVPPWNEVERNPHIWHFVFHSIPELPEILVQRHQREYFDYFYEILSVDPGAITVAARAEYAAAYATTGALTAGFNWYRTFAEDARHNARTNRLALMTPVLYLCGDGERGNIESYVEGLRSAGHVNVQHALIPHAGHFAPEEAPAATWRAISAFAGLETIRATR